MDFQGVTLSVETVIRHSFGRQKVNLLASAKGHDDFVGLQQPVVLYLPRLSFE